MRQWEFEMPDSQDPGDHVFALVVCTGVGKEIDVRCMEKAEVIERWHSFVFAWQAIDYPAYGINELGLVVDTYRMQQRQEP